MGVDCFNALLYQRERIKSVELSEDVQMTRVAGRILAPRVDLPTLSAALPHAVCVCVLPSIQCPSLRTVRIGVAPLDCCKYQHRWWPQRLERGVVDEETGRSPTLPCLGWSPRQMEPHCLDERSTCHLLRSETWRT